MSQAADATHAHAPTSTGIDHKKLIMWLFLASDCMFFGTLISTHLLYNVHGVLRGARIDRAAELRADRGQCAQRNF